MRALLLSALGLGVATAASQQDFDSVRREFEEGIRASQPRLEREGAIKLCSEHKGLEPTRVLLRAMEECLDHARVLERQFDELGRELADILDGSTDGRLAPKSRQEEMQQRIQIGERIAEEGELLELVLERLSQRRDEESLQLLIGLPNKPRDWRTRSCLIDVLGRMKDTRALAELHEALRDKDPRVRLASADALGQIGAEESVAFLASTLEDREWPVRAAALQAMGSIASAWAVPHLIENLAREKGRLKQESAELLVKLSGRDLGLEAEAWQRWWNENRQEVLGGVDTPEVATRKAKDVSNPFSYYGITTYSDKVIFILDISDSMNDDAEETELPEDGIPRRTGNLRPKIQVARDQLSQTIVDLPQETTFNIIVYNKYVRAWQREMMPATRRNKNDALSYILSLQATEATNVFDALELAFHLAGRYVGDRYYASPVDTIFFLTDGKPTHGRIQDPERILQEVRRINKVGKIKIHTIGVGYLHDRDFLQKLAAENGGRYVNIQ